MKQAGIAYATEQIIDLMANGIRAVHVYSMNKPDVAKKYRTIYLKLFRQFGRQKENSYVSEK